jgi:curved DNA-binding protein CbpA
MTGVMDPYRILGVEKIATAAEIKAAYRTLSKLAHPDAGGDRETFERIRAAYDVLKDPADRHHFDTTGETRGRQPDNAKAEAVSALGSAFNTIISQIVQRGLDHKKTDIVVMMRTLLENEITSRGPTLDAATKERAIWIEMRPRFTTATGKPNHLAAMVDAKIARIDQAVHAIYRADEIANAALDLLDDYEYRVDAQEFFVAWQSGGFATGNASGTGGFFSD